MRPDVSLWRRMPGAVFVLAFYIILAGFFDRPLMAAILTLGSVAALHGVSRVKEKVLFEPLVADDVALLGQVFRHPALYIAYVGYRRFVVLAAAFAAGFFALILSEAPAGWSWLVRLAMMAVPGSAALFIFRQIFLPRCSLTLRPDEDQARYGLISMLALYAVAIKPPLSDISNCPLPRIDGRSPHIVLVQAESFYDPRRFWPEPYRSAARQALRLPVWDRLCAEGATGILHVPARGANTMRSEFSVLSGQEESALGFHKFNPLLSIRRTPVATLVTRLAEAGYRTLALHPYDGRFFGRSRCYPLMGFQSFRDETAFQAVPRRGPYISDAGLGRAIASVLGEAPEPCFLFAITMENHGPWSESRYGAEERDAVAAAFPGLPFPLAAYCHHLQGTDDLLRHVVEAAEEQNRGIVLGLYGDHPPSFPGVRQEPPLPQTSFLIWSSSGKRPLCPETVESARFLPILLGESLSGQGVGACQG